MEGGSPLQPDCSWNNKVLDTDERLKEYFTKFHDPDSLEDVTYRVFAKVAKGIPVRVVKELAQKVEVSATSVLHSKRNLILCRHDSKSTL